MVSRGSRTGSRAPEKPLRRIHWISPIQIETRASSAAYGLISMPLTLAGSTPGKLALKAPESLRLQLHPVFEVLQGMKGQVEEVAGPAGRVQYSERA